jgi:hypothetical protein
MFVYLFIMCIYIIIYVTCVSVHIFMYICSLKKWQVKFHKRHMNARLENCCQASTANLNKKAWNRGGVSRTIVAVVRSKEDTFCEEKRFQILPNQTAMWHPVIIDLVRNCQKNKKSCCQFVSQSFQRCQIVACPGWAHLGLLDVLQCWRTCIESCNWRFASMFDQCSIRICAKFWVRSNANKNTAPALWSQHGFAQHLSAMSKVSPLEDRCCIRWIYSVGYRITVSAHEQPVMCLRPDKSSNKGMEIW